MAIWGIVADSARKIKSVITTTAAEKRLQTIAVSEYFIRWFNIPSSSTQNREADSKTQAFLKLTYRELSPKSEVLGNLFDSMSFLTSFSKSLAGPGPAITSKVKHSLTIEK
jgi:hypothetical protein